MTITSRNALRRLYRCLPAVLWLALLLPAAGQEEATRQALDDGDFSDIAAHGNAATVGIYCHTTEYFRFYGTGVLVSADGFMLTSTTVVPPDAKEIKVHLADHTILAARVVEANEGLEAVLLKADNGDRELPFLPVADELPVVGETAFTYGNAHSMLRLGAGPSFSVGTISGVYHVESIDTQSSYTGLAIETDAAVNPGQDGGPLLNSRDRKSTRLNSSHYS